MSQHAGKSKMSLTRIMLLFMLLAAALLESSAFGISKLPMCTAGTCPIGGAPLQDLRNVLDDSKSTAAYVQWLRIDLQAPAALSGSVNILVTQEATSTPHPNHTDHTQVHSFADMYGVYTSNVLYTSFTDLQTAAASLTQCVPPSEASSLEGDITQYAYTCNTARGMFRYLYICRRTTVRHPPPMRVRTRASTVSRHTLAFDRQATALIDARIGEIVLRLR